MVSLEILKDIKIICGKLYWKVKMAELVLIMDKRQNNKPFYQPSLFFLILQNMM